MKKKEKKKPSDTTRRRLKERNNKRMQDQAVRQGRTTERSVAERERKISTQHKAEEIRIEEYI